MFLYRNSGQTGGMIGRELRIFGYNITPLDLRYASCRVYRGEQRQLRISRRNEIEIMYMHGISWSYFDCVERARQAAFMLKIDQI